MKIEIYGIKNTNRRKIFKTFAKNILMQCPKKIPNNAKVLNIIFVNNNYIQKLNKQFLKRNRSTDVLSFPINPVRYDHKLVNNKTNTYRLSNGVKDEILGEIYISKDRAKIQAKQRKISVNEEICNLIEHGILHLFGYSHTAMKKLQN